MDDLSDEAKEHMPCLERQGNSPSLKYVKETQFGTMPCEMQSVRREKGPQEYFVNFPEDWKSRFLHLDYGYLEVRQVLDKSDEWQFETKGLTIGRPSTPSFKVEFDISFADKKDKFVGAKHGTTWTTEEKQVLKSLFVQGYGLEDLCRNMERPAAGILPKLVEMRLLHKENHGDYRYKYYLVHTQQPQPQPQPKEETMNYTAPIIEVKTFINGVDASSMSDAQIFSKILEIENRLANYGVIKAKSVKLEMAMEALKADIADLVAYVDGRP